MVLSLFRAPHGAGLTAGERPQHNCFSYVEPPQQFCSSTVLLGEPSVERLIASVIKSSLWLQSDIGLHLSYFLHMPRPQYVHKHRALN